MASIKIYSKEQVDTLLAQIPSGPSEYVKDVTGSDYTETGYNGQKITVTDEDDANADITTAKYYTATGQNTDGSMTQKAITDALAGAGGGVSLHTYTDFADLYQDMINHPEGVLIWQEHSSSGLQLSGAYNIPATRIQNGTVYIALFKFSWSDLSDAYIFRGQVSMTSSISGASISGSTFYRMHFKTSSPYIEASSNVTYTLGITGLIYIY